MTLRKWSDLTEAERIAVLDECRCQARNHLRNRIKVDVRNLIVELTVYEREQDQKRKEVIE